MISQRNTFLSYLAQTSDEPLMIEPKFAQGIYITDVHDKRYIDLISGIGVSNVGHRHPAVVKATKDQIDKYMHVMVYGEFVQSPQASLAKKICSFLPENLQNVYLVNSGSEAVEGALKVAKKYTGRTEVFSIKDCYHGNTQAIMALMSDEERKFGYGPYPEEYKQIVFNEKEELNKITEETAAVILETVMGEAGCKVHSNVYIKALREKCDEVGALLILDEVQCGIGRTGKMFAFEHSTIVPDILILAKGIGGGMPIGAFISSKKIMSSFIQNPVLGHITTFGGHPVCSAAALATLEIIDGALVEEVGAKEKQFRDALVHPKIKSVSGKGLMLAVQLATHEEVKEVIDYCLEKGLITDWFLFAPDCIRIAPPLIIDEESITFACSIILEALEKLS